MSKVKANAAVRRGVKLLDKYVPGWWKPAKISLRKLDISDSCNCVCGQLESHGVREPFDGFWMSENGFDARWPYGSPDTWSYDELQAAWEREIKTRRELAKTLAKVAS